MKGDRERKIERKERKMKANREQTVDKLLDALRERGRQLQVGYGKLEELKDERERERDQI